MTPVFELQDLRVTLHRHHRSVELVKGVSFSVNPGECLGILGESGSGKSMSIKAAMGLLNKSFQVSGSARFGGEELMGKSAEELRRLRGGKVGIILQNPMTCFDPLYRVGYQIAETFTAHRNWDSGEIRRRSLEMLDKMRIRNPEEVLEKYPHQLSGGMRQRVVIAIALSCDPDLLICDEPTTALDVTIQAKILELIRSIQKERGISVIYITHDLGVVAKVADYVDVMYAGKIVETGTIDEIFYDPRHPYTWGLLSAMPDLDTADERLYTIPGSPPNLLHEKAGDAFAPRNKYALEIDDEIDPPMFKISDTHFAATWLLDPRAPKVEMPPELKDRVARMSAEAKKIEEAE